VREHFPTIRHLKNGLSADQPSANKLWQTSSWVGKSGFMTDFPSLGCGGRFLKVTNFMQVNPVHEQLA
jgi:hypothetical protein